MRLLNRESRGTFRPDGITKGSQSTFRDVVVVTSMMLTHAETRPALRSGNTHPKSSSRCRRCLVPKPLAPTHRCISSSIQIFIITPPTRESRLNCILIVCISVVEWSIRYSIQMLGDSHEQLRVLFGWRSRSRSRSRPRRFVRIEGEGILRRCAGRPAAMIVLSHAMLSMSIDGWEFEAVYIYVRNGRLERIGEE